MLDVKVYDMPEVKINFEPETVFIKNPVVTFTFENSSADSIQIIDWNWNFGDSTYSTQEVPVKVFEDVRLYSVWLKYTTSDECIDSVKIDVDVKAVKLGIPNVFTPNGDEYNQVFEIKELENYMSNELMIFNRYGKKVFSQTNYQSDWDGDNVKEGVYFYVLRADGYFGTDTYRGSVTIIRRQ
jgi:gliding motility-associated-like protein